MLFCNGFPRSFVLTTNRLADQIDSSGEAALVIAVSEIWLDVVCANVIGSDVWHGAFQAISDLDRYLAILGEHKEHYAIAPFLLADAPSLCDALRVVRDIRVALHLRKNGDHDLIGRFALELRKLLVETLGRFF